MDRYTSRSERTQKNSISVTVTQLQPLELGATIPARDQIRQDSFSERRDIYGQLFKLQ